MLLKRHARTLAKTASLRLLEFGRRTTSCCFFFISLFAEASRKLLSKSFARSNKARKVSLEVVGFVPLQFKWIDAVQTILNCGNWIVDQYRALPASINKHSKLLENFQPDFAAFLPAIFHRYHSTRWYKLSQFRKSWQISTRKSSFESQPQTTTRKVKLGSILHPTPHSRRRPAAKQEFGIKTTHTHTHTQQLVRRNASAKVGATTSTYVDGKRETTTSTAPDLMSNDFRFKFWRWCLAWALGRGGGCMGSAVRVLKCSLGESWG